jgi:hypothetical protein
VRSVPKPVWTRIGALTQPFHTDGSSGG